MQVYLEKNDYIIQSVEPLSTLKEKRLAVFILVKEKSNARQLSVITREAVQEVKYADVYLTQKWKISMAINQQMLYGSILDMMKAIW